MSNKVSKDERFIKRCFELAGNGLGHVSPNPLVGCVLVKGEKIIGEGWHRKAGESHAEVEAILHSKESVRGATLYCNLEPCCHTDKETPPCANLIIRKGIKRVVISNLDPNPQVSGKGVEMLINHDLEVVVGVLKNEGESLNKVFFKWITTGFPYIHLKWAQTLDGRLASCTGDSRWISTERARVEIHRLRLNYDAILVGKNTVNVDNPSLSVRMGVESNGKTPWRIVVGTPEKLNWEAKVFNDEASHKTILAIPKGSYLPKKAVDKSIQIWENSPMQCGKVNIQSLLKELGKRKITSLLVEGGPVIHTTFLEENLWDEYTGYITPRLMGNGPSLFESSSRNLINNSLILPKPQFRFLENQVVIEGRKSCLQD